MELESRRVDRPVDSFNNTTMEPTTSDPRMQPVSDASVPMIRDAESIRKACEVMDAIRNDVQRRVGVVDLDLTDRDE